MAEMDVHRMIRPDVISALIEAVKIDLFDKYENVLSDGLRDHCMVRTDASPPACGTLGEQVKMMKNLTKVVMTKNNGQLMMLGEGSMVLQHPVLDHLLELCVLLRNEAFINIHAAENVPAPPVEGDIMPKTPVEIQTSTAVTQTTPSMTPCQQFVHPYNPPTELGGKQVTSLKHVASTESHVKKLKQAYEQREKTMKDLLKEEYHPKKQSQNQIARLNKLLMQGKQEDAVELPKNPSSSADSQMEQLEQALDKQEKSFNNALKESQIQAQEQIAELKLKLKGAEERAVHLEKENFALKAELLSNNHRKTKMMLDGAGAGTDVGQADKPDDFETPLLRSAKLTRGSKRSVLLKWSQEKIQAFAPSIKLENSSSSWQSGVALRVLMEVLLDGPELSNEDFLTLVKRNDPKANFQAALKAGESVGIRATLDVDDILAAGDRPDWYNIQGYIESVFNHFNAQ